MPHETQHCGHLSKRPTVTPAFLHILADLFHIFPLQRVVKLGFNIFSSIQRILHRLGDGRVGGLPIPTPHISTGKSQHPQQGGGILKMTIYIGDIKTMFAIY